MGMTDASPKGLIHKPTGAIIAPDSPSLVPSSPPDEPDADPNGLLAGVTDADGPTDHPHVPVTNADAELVPESLESLFDAPLPSFRMFW